MTLSQLFNKHLDTDLKEAQSNIYRRFAANLYGTKRDNEYYHLYGSLVASTALRMIGLPPFNTELAEYREVIDHIEQQMKRFTVEELEEKNQENQQAGTKAYKREDILKADYVTGISTSECGHGHFPIPPLDLSCCFFSLSCR
jgi:hypothetical protein